jgi:hypothetical protein
MTSQTASDTFDAFDPAHPENQHDDFPAVMRAVEKAAATLARVREYDGLEAAADAERERLELYQHIADLIECGAVCYDVNQILGERGLARKRARKLARKAARWKWKPTHRKRLPRSKPEPPINPTSAARRTK